jgi:hypothetical protein
MPTYIRKIYIAKHNEKINEQNEKIKQKNRKNKK